MADSYMTTEDVAEYLAVPARTVEGWRARGMGKHGSGPPAYRFGRGVRYKRSEVEAWAKAQRLT